jgi:hypothetical protein
VLVPALTRDIIHLNILLFLFRNAQFSHFLFSTLINHVQNFALTISRSQSILLITPNAYTYLFVQEIKVKNKHVKLLIVQHRNLITDISMWQSPQSLWTQVLILLLLSFLCSNICSLLYAPRTYHKLAKFVSKFDCKLQRSLCLRFLHAMELLSISQ